LLQQPPLAAAAIVLSASTYSDSPHKEVFGVMNHLLLFLR
jgi:hypothetical protein